MLTYLIKRKMHHKKHENESKKAIMYTGLAITGVGAYLSYKAIKNHKCKCKMNQETYLNSCDSHEHHTCDCGHHHSHKESELEKKITEFNSKRINSENCTHVSPEDMEHFINKTENSNLNSNKKNIDIEELDNGVNEEYEEFDETQNK